MNWTHRIVNRIRNTNGWPKSGQVVLPRVEDTFRDYPSAGLTPSRLAAILRDADAGSLSASMQLFEEMEEKDPHLYAVAHTRRLALTGLDWRVLSASRVRDGVDRAAADEAADFCRKVLSELDSLDEGCNTCPWRWGGTSPSPNWCGSRSAASSAWWTSCRSTSRGSSSTTWTARAS